MKQFDEIEKAELDGLTIEELEPPVATAGERLNTTVSRVLSENSNSVRTLLAKALSNLDTRRIEVYNQINFQKSKLDELISEIETKQRILEIYDREADLIILNGNSPSLWEPSLLEGSSSRLLVTSSNLEGLILPVKASVKIAYTNPRVSSFTALEGSIEALRDARVDTYMLARTKELKLTFDIPDLVNCLNIDAISQSQVGLQSIEIFDGAVWHTFSYFNERSEGNKLYYLPAISGKSIRITLVSEVPEIKLREVNMYKVSFDDAGVLYSKELDIGDSKSIGLSIFKRLNEDHIDFEVYVLEADGAWRQLTEIGEDSREIGSVDKSTRIKIVMKKKSGVSLSEFQSGIMYSLALGAA